MRDTRLWIFVVGSGLVAGADGALTVTLLRHGETEWNTQSKIQGASDSPLTEEGVEQAIRCGQRLKAFPPFDACYASPLLRAKRTASLVLQQLDSPPPLSLEDALRERSFGTWEGETWETIQAERMDEVRQSRENADYATPGGESRAEVLERALSFLNSLTTRHPSGGSVICVTHSATITCILKQVLGLQQQAGRTWEVKNLGINTLKYDEQSGGWMLLRLGDTTHLADEPPIDLAVVREALERERQKQDALGERE